MNIFLLDQDAFFIVFIIAVIVLIIILRGLLKNYIISNFMCVIFSIITIVLAIIIMTKNEDEKIDFAPWILYTTISSMMYLFGPEVFVEDLDYKIEFHEWLTTSFFTIEKRRTPRIIIYLIVCAVLSIVLVNLLGYSGKAFGVLFIIPGICLLISAIRIIKWFAD